jgi:hypothetical protein
MDALGARGISGYDLAHEAKVHPETVSRIMRGFRVYPRTAGRLMDALIAIPVIAGSEILLIAAGEPDAIGDAGISAALERAALPRRKPPDPNEGIPPDAVDGLRVVDVTNGHKPSRTPTASTFVDGDTDDRRQKEIAAADDSAAAIQGVGHGHGPAPA